MKLKLFILAMVVLLAACAQEPTEDAEDGSSEVPKQETVNQEPMQYDATVAQLRDKAMKENGFHYTFVRRERDEFGNYITTDDYEVFIIGGKIRKMYLEPRRLDAVVFYSEVYLDSNKATVVCAKTTMSLCSPFYKKAYAGDYAREKLPFTIRDVMEDIPARAMIAGSAVLDNRKTTIITYEAIGKQYKVYIDDFYGLPLKQEVRDEDNGKLILVEESRFSLRDEVTPDDVMLPEGYEVQG